MGFCCQQFSLDSPLAWNTLRSSEFNESNKLSLIPKRGEADSYLFKCFLAKSLNAGRGLFVFSLDLCFLLSSSAEEVI